MINEGFFEPVKSKKGEVRRQRGKDEDDRQDFLFSSFSLFTSPVSLVFKKGWNNE